MSGPNAIGDYVVDLWHDTKLGRWALRGKHIWKTAMLWELAQKLRPGDGVIADRCYAEYFLRKKKWKIITRR